jgi:hypothetical protein
LRRHGGAYKPFAETADFIARAIQVRSEGGASADTVNTLMANDRPDLWGGTILAGSARHSTYVEISAYRHHMQRIRKRLGWPALASGAFDGQLRRPAAS